MAMAVGTLLLVPIVDAAKEECQEMMGDENDKQLAEQLGFPWLLVIVLCFTVLSRFVSSMLSRSCACVRVSVCRSGVLCCGVVFPRSV